MKTASVILLDPTCAMCKRCPIPSLTLCSNLQDNPNKSSHTYLFITFTLGKEVQ